jgi:chromate transporter
VAPPVASPPSGTEGRLGELLRLFLRLGLTAFGGPAAHVALMEDEVVRRRGWLSRQAFLDLLGATNLIPGPNSTELALHIGLQRAGWRGLMVAGLSFVAPSACMVAALAVIYVHWGRLPAALAIFSGIKAVMIAVVVQALVALTRSAVQTPILAVIGGAGLAAVLLGLPEIGVLLAAGLVSALASRRSRDGAVAGAPATTTQEKRTFIGGDVMAGTLLGVSGSLVGGSVHLALFAAFLKMGALVFGSGYVLLAFLRNELVTNRAWISEAQLIDAVAAGQVTPGPLFTAATFIGYLVAGGWGALLATVAIFLPAFVLVAASGALLPRLRGSARAGAFLDGVNVASLALMAVVTVQLMRAALVDVVSIVLASASAVILIWRRPNPGWLVLMGAIVGFLRTAVG